MLCQSDLAMYHGCWGWGAGEERGRGVSHDSHQSRRSLNLTRSRCTHVPVRMITSLAMHEAGLDSPSLTGYLAPLEAISDAGYLQP